jgi:hypothetical protein
LLAEGIQGFQPLWKLKYVQVCRPTPYKFTYHYVRGERRVIDFKCLQ